MVINIMTPSLVTGDAIGNYIYTLRRILMEQGFPIRLYADGALGMYRVLSQHTSRYRPTGRDVLWFHYSLDFSGMDWPRRSNDFRIMDFHGVSPPELFQGYNSHLADLCHRGVAQLPGLVNQFDLCVVHSDYARTVLEENGCRRPIVKLPLVVDLRRFNGAEDLELSRLLKQLEYVLFVGRIVPQKGILDLLEVFAQLRQRRPAMKLFLVGDGSFSKRYLKEVHERIHRLGLDADVLLAGKISAAETLTSFYSYARFSIFLSEWESFCVPVVESAYFGTPVIGNRIGPLPETVGEAGLLVDKADHAGAAALMDSVLSDPERYAALGTRGRTHALHYTEGVLREEVRAVLAKAGLKP